MHKELKTLRWEKDQLTKIVENNNQNKLKASKFHALIIIKKALNSAKLEKNKTIFDNRDYEKEINNANSPEEVEVIQEEFLLHIVENFPEQGIGRAERTKPNYSSNYSLTKQKDHKILEKLVEELVKMGDNKDNIQNLENKLAQSEQKTKEVAEQLNNFQQNAAREAQRLKKETHPSNKPKNNFNWNINSWFILFVISIFFIIVRIVIGSWKKK